MPQTLTNSIPSSFRRIAFALPLTVLIDIPSGADYGCFAHNGTGASVNECNFGSSGKPFDEIISGNARDSSAPVGMIAENLDFIKSTLSLTTSELAKFLGVSRQAVYDWKSGATVKVHNLSKVENLAAAADVIASNGLAINGLQLKRKLPGGMSLLEIIAAGRDGKAAARSLVHMLQQEIKQRNELVAKFAGRKPKMESSYGMGIAALREDS